MRIVLVLKPYAIEVYSREGDVYTLVSIEQATRIDGESLDEYEKRMVFVCKDICTEMHASPYFKEIARKVDGIDVVLSTPWCTYEVIHIEKDFGKKTKITESLVASLAVKKDEKDFQLVESYMSRILLNGYTVAKLEGQMAQLVELQYVHVYAQKSLITLLTKSLETIFHTHTVSIISIYGLIECISQKKNITAPSELKIVVEDESLDISYVSEGSHITNMFIPYSQRELEQAIALQLSTDIPIVQQILQSRSECVEQGQTVPIHKNAKKIWPDLEPAVQKTIEDVMSQHMEKILKDIRNCVDTVAPEFLKTSSCIRIYGTHIYTATVYGAELVKRILADPYITMKMSVYLEKDSIVSIF